MPEAELLFGIARFLRDESWLDVALLTLSLSLGGCRKVGLNLTPYAP